MSLEDLDLQDVVQVLLDSHKFSAFIWQAERYFWTKTSAAVRVRGVRPGMFVLWASKKPDRIGSCESFCW